MKVILTKSATADIEEAIEFYENQDLGAGKYFLDSIREDILRLKESAGVHRKALGKYHRMICTHHPYAVFMTLPTELPQSRQCSTVAVLLGG